MVLNQRDVTSLLMGMLSGHKDDYGKDVVPPLPLSFDRVNEGRLPLPSSSNSILFRFPVEILAPIVQYLPSESLASLALVNRDCRQLARSRQFASVQFDYSNHSLDLIGLLCEESNQRKHNNSQTLLPSLGACIRRLTVATHPGWLSARHDIELSEEFMELPKEERDKRIEKAARAFFDRYVPDVLSVLSTALPHLELLDWEDKIDFYPHFFASIARSPVRHLKLFRVSVGEDFEITLPKGLVNGVWPLRTLHLEIYWGFWGSSDGSIAKICSSMLRACSPTLESLTWRSMRYGNEKSKTLTEYQHDSQLQFPSLRQLDIEQAPPASLMLRNLLSSPLRGLHAKTKQCESLGTIESLETFAWGTYGLEADDPLEFLRNNTQLTKLWLSSPASPVFLESNLLPLIAQSFSRLRSLSLIWDEKFIPEEPLRFIGTLESLEQLCLSAGNWAGWRRDWKINHKTMRKQLASLTNLKKLAFARDSYSQPGSWIPIESYYEACIPWDLDFNSITDYADQRSTKAIFEYQHRKFILGEANKYLRVLPTLEWLYFGQIPMEIIDKDDVPEQFRYSGVSSGTHNGHSGDEEVEDPMDSDVDDSYDPDEEAAQLPDDDAGMTYASDADDSRPLEADASEAFDYDNDSSTNGDAAVADEEPDLDVKPDFDDESDAEWGDKEDDGRRAVPLSMERDDCWTLLRRMFGFGGSDE